MVARSTQLRHPSVYRSSTVSEIFTHRDLLLFFEGGRCSVLVQFRIKSLRVSGSKLEFKRSDSSMFDMQDLGFCSGLVESSVASGNRETSRRRRPVYAVSSLHL